MLTPAKTAPALTGAQRSKAIRAAIRAAGLDVEYIAQVGYCGPDWKEATAIAASFSF